MPDIVSQTKKSEGPDSASAKLDLMSLKVPEKELPRLELKSSKETHQEKVEQRPGKTSLENFGTKELDKEHHHQVAAGQVKGFGAGVEIKMAPRSSHIRTPLDHSVFAQQQNEQQFMMLSGKRKRKEKDLSGVMLQSIIRARVQAVIGDEIEIYDAVKHLAKNVALGSGKDTLDSALEKVILEAGRVLLEKIVGQMQQDQTLILDGEDDAEVRDLIKSILKERILHELEQEKRCER